MLSSKAFWFFCICCGSFLLLYSLVEKTQTPCICDFPPTLDQEDVTHTALLSEKLLKVDFPHGFTAYVSTELHQDWWVNTFPTWEPQTFEVFRKYIGPETTYLGFGEWIGPTVLYAAQIAKRAIALEPDPVAYRGLVENVNANHDLFHNKVHISPLCISNRTETVLMTGTGVSGSIVLDTVINHYMDFYKGNPVFQIDCVTLMVFVREHRLDPARLFIKMDTEGAEGFIVPSLLEWYRTLPTKPTMFISRHLNDLSYLNTTIVQRFVDVMRLYRYAGLISDVRLGSEFSDKVLNSCEYCDFLASDVDPLVST